MTPEIYFKQALDLDDEVKSKQKERDSIRETALGSSGLEQVPIFSNQFNSTTENMILKLSECDERINSLIDQLVDFKMKLSVEIDQMNDRRYRIVLRERYIRCKSWANIAIEQNYDKRYIYELHGHALSEFKKEFPDKFN